ncbi:MAG TPA: glycoside hydrolase family 3 C-terminal domain-containing protein [Cyclobacteriaceae bacterium]|nr:glycoside hydrolase family 3 C-terminal domain-containing protein [Cyclobacteriaceae bacterium]HMV10749.1 glycoside hydrolase family 3 C-terminal domain-containing protein [Cyclobacteriaceae bacterium]HMV91718.1 glycoside hydrolase family 3 C-terminal domain-containing protein [Cyclobacteriaceae bacterium]HMX01669.1 glycoside hydrolase family 3 C-terminal domain-containing protein [Cyclobacteriaceae bacterium]HMX51346.1 glycoside hydrolase family 3 C-terminal domain-containing protein [Cyclo
MIRKSSVRLIIVYVLLATLFSCTSSPEKKSLSIEQKIDSVLSQMTLEEKVTMIHASSSFTTGAVPRLGIPEWTMSDGPHGVRKEHGRGWVGSESPEYFATYLPVGVSLASTWNPELGYTFGKVLGEEARYRGKDVILGPGINILRTPLNGRNFEYLSEDPYLISKMVVEYIKGVQDQHVAACVKHYLANNQETDRNTVSVEMNERTLREIYLPGFAAAVKEGGVYTLMGAYNKFRGQYCTHHEYLINKVLKEELGFDGAVISDWGAVHSTLEALKFGTDVEMGTDLSQGEVKNYDKFFMGDTVISLVKSGVIKESLINDKVRRILRIMYRTKVIGGGDRGTGSFNTPEHQAAALKIAEEAIVLLKNEGSLLPLNKSSVKNVAIIGANANRKQGGGGGSSQVNAKYEITPLQGIEKMLFENVQVTYAEGYEVARDAKANANKIKEAAEAARKADASILVCGWIHGYTDSWNDNAYDAESVDKPNMFLPFGQDELINAVLKANPNTIIVIMGGGPVDMTKWESKAKAILFAGYPGMEGGTPIGKIIFGELNPSGKLTMTFPKRLEDSPAHAIGEYPGKDNVVYYNEGIMVGYRYFDTKKVQPQFPFGHGLSYTTFLYENLQLTKGDNQSVVATVTVRNTGSRAGAEVMQLYVKDIESSVERPDKELKGFQKVFLQPGESKDIILTLSVDAFRFFDEKKMEWVLEPGKFQVMAGSSSRDIRLTKEIDL